MVTKTVYKPVAKPKPIFPGGTLTPPKFVPTYYEWLRKRGTQIIKKDNNSGTAEFSIYDVPANHTLFITSCWVSLVDDGAGVPGISFVSLMDGKPVAVAKYLVTVFGYSPVAFSTSNSVAFNPPVEFREGEGVYLKMLNVATGIGGVGFAGFLVRNGDIPQF